MQDRVGGFFDKSRGDLPMYKDKPYTYASSRRQRPAWRRKRTLGLAGAFLLAVLYFLGFFGSHTENVEKVKEKWTWLQKPEKEGPQVDWLDRREHVKEAFTLSWDAYERYAWGM
jgi:endoplasmic reticulum Man9GlcNAc2 1,2-alpha-mannosidase